MLAVMVVAWWKLAKASWEGMYWSTDVEVKQSMGEPDENAAAGLPDGHDSVVGHELNEVEPR